MNVEHALDGEWLRFDSRYKVEGRLPRDFTQDEVKNEPMLFNADFEFAWQNAGPITKAVMMALPMRFLEGPVVIDSRVHMLMPSWFPCIPGWHLDDIPRTRADGQPDHINPAYKAEHAMCIVGDASRTAFAVGQIGLKEPSLGEVIYGEWHLVLEDIIEWHAQNGRQDLLRVEQVNPLDIVTFNDESFHQGTAAVKNGWRYFIRITRNTQRVPTNEIRRQVQTYLPAIVGGW